MDQCVVDFDRVCIGECATRKIVLKNIGALGTDYQIAKVCALFLSTCKLKCVYLRTYVCTYLLHLSVHTYVHGYALVDTVEACDLCTYLCTYIHSTCCLCTCTHVLFMFDWEDLMLRVFNDTHGYTLIYKNYFYRCKVQYVNTITH